MTITDLRTLLDLGATYPYSIENKDNRYEVNFFDEEGDVEPIRTITIYKD